MSKKRLGGSFMNELPPRLYGRGFRAIQEVKITGELNNEIRQLFKKYSSFITIDSHILYDKNHTPIIYNIYYKNIPVEYHNDFEKEVLAIRRKQLEKENNHKKELIELL